MTTPILWTKWRLRGRPLTEWFVENYPHFTNKEIVGVFEKEFGIRPSKKALRRFASKCGVRKSSQTIARANREGTKARLSLDKIDNKGKVYNGVKAEDVIAYLRKGPATVQELSDYLDRGGSTIASVLVAMIADGYGIRLSENTVTLPLAPPLPDKPQTLADVALKDFRFAAIADLHLGSKYSQLTNFHAFAKEAVEDYGVNHFLVAGDITAGNGKVYSGQSQDLYIFGSDEQVDNALDSIPQIDGVTWILAGGNHDYSFYKDEGTNIVKRIADGRDDILYVGFDAVDVPLTDTIDARMWHPVGGVPYAISYRGQKYAAQVAFEELLSVIFGEKSAGPTIRFLLIGHLHIMAYFAQGPIQVFQVGCFESQNSYLRRKGLTPDIGGWIIDVGMTEQGVAHKTTIHRLSYTAIQDDYKYHYNPQRATQVTYTIDPLF